MAIPFKIEGGNLMARLFGETLRVEAHGPDALRIRARPGLNVADPHVNALLDPPPSDALIKIADAQASIQNGRIRAELKVVPRHGADVLQQRETALRR